MSAERWTDGWAKLQRHVRSTYDLARETYEASRSGRPDQLGQPNQPEEAPEGAFGVPVVRCPSCGGEGTTRLSAPTGYHQPGPCSPCAGRGLVRAQLVLSLLDQRTGRVASRSIVPGSLTPVAAPSGQAALDLGAVIHELATALEVNVASIYRASPPEMVPWDPKSPWLLPLRYPAKAAPSDEWRLAYEGAAIARETSFQPNLILYAGVEPVQRPSADESLRRLVAISGQLQLDLVIDVRVERSETLVWSVRLDLPGADGPEHLIGTFATLHRALRETSVETALAWLRSRSGSGPARWLETSEKDSENNQEHAVTEGSTWAEFSARLTPLAISGEGAVAVHRQGEWFFSALGSANDPETDLRTRLRPVTALPEPAGALIPTSPCSKCDGGSRTLSTRCHRCGGEGTVLDGVAVTITDLSGRTKHINWSPVPTVAGEGRQERETVSGVPLRDSEALLDGYYSVGEQAKAFSVPPHRLRDQHRNAALDPSVIDAKVSVHDGDPQVIAYLRKVARRRPGGRLIVLARPEPQPPTGDLVRSVLGLGLTLTVGVRSERQPHRPPAPAVSSWWVQLVPAAETDPSRSGIRFGSSQPSLLAAVAELQAGFDSGVHRALRVDKLAPAPVPQQAVPVRVDLDAIEGSLEGLADIYPDADIRLSVDLVSWSCFVGPPYNRSACAGTIVETLAELLAPDLIEPQREDLRRLFDLLLDQNSTEAQLDAETQGFAGRFRFGLVLTSMLKCLFVERFGLDPEPAVLERYALATHREDIDSSAEDGVPPPEPALFTELLVALADPTRTASRRMLLAEHLSVAMSLLGCLLRDRRESGAEITAIIDQAVEEAILMAQALAARGPAGTSSDRKHEQ